MNSPPSNRLRAVLLSLALGLTTSLLLALAASLIRPTDGFHNILGTSPVDFENKYLLPPFRLRSAQGDIYVDITGNSIHTEVSLDPTWTQPARPVWSAAPNYPYPEEIPAAQLAPFHKPTFRLPYWAALPTAASTDTRLITSAWGWPLRCLSGIEHAHFSSPPGSYATTTREFQGYYIRGTTSSRIRRIPYHVIPLGLAANSLLFAAAWSFILWVPRIVRRRLRLRRDQCPHCNYNLQGLTPNSNCPECGRTSTRHRP